MRPMNISYIGLKGIPAKWGGIEVYVEEVSKRLAERGHVVNVYSRRWYNDSIKEYQGINIITTPTLAFRATDAILHGLSSSIHSCFTGCDIVHYHGLFSYFFSFLPRLAGKKVVGTIHSADLLNPKWSSFDRAVIRAGYWFALRVPHRVTVVARYMKELLKIKNDALEAPGGIDIRDRREPDMMLEYGLKRNGYVLFIGRFEEQKRIDWIIRAYKECGKQDIKLVIAGGSSHSGGHDYDGYLRRLAGDDRNIIFTGYVSGALKEEFLSNALLMVLPSFVEGMPITLVEGLSYGLNCLVSDIPAHKEFIGQGLVYSFSGEYEDFLGEFKLVIDGISSSDPEQKRGERREYVLKNYTWDNTVDKLEDLYLQLVGR